MSQTATMVQKTMKNEVYTLFLEANVGATGAVTKVTSNGVSKLGSIEKVATGKYNVYWDLPAQVNLGAPSAVVVNAASASGDLYSSQVLSTFTSYNNEPASGFSFQVFRVSGSTEAAPVNPPNGSKLLITGIASTSPVF